MTIGAYAANSYMNYSGNAWPGAVKAGYSGMQQGRQAVPSQGAQQQPSLMPQVFPLQPYSSNIYRPAAKLYGSIDGDRAELSMPARLPESGLLSSLKPEGECKTCAERKYVDGSDDPSVSYQSPTKINSSMAGAAVAAHEQEHVRNEQADAQRDGREIVNQSVTLHYDTCPECGKMYVSGGTTRTTSVSKKESENFKAPEDGDARGSTPDAA